MPRVSVVIPSYNHENYIVEAIQSVLDQTYQDFEIIITDDGSTDNTVNVIQKFTDPRIKLFAFETNQGASVSLNYCIKNSTGQFISLLNSDDVWLSQKLEKQVQFLDNHPEIGAVFSYPKFIDENSKILTEDHFYKVQFQKINRTRFKWLNHFFYHGNCLCHPSVLIRKECYDTVGLYDPRYAQLPDFEFWIRLCKQYEIYIIPEDLIKFRIRDNEANASGRRSENYVRISLEMPQIYKNYLDIDILKNLLIIFPEIYELNPFVNDYEFDQKVYKYFLAQLALKTEFNSVHYFGIDIMFQLMNSPEFVHYNKSHFIISYKNLIKLTGNIDPFREKMTQDYWKIQENLSILKKSNFFQLRKIWLNIKSRIGFNLSDNN